MSITLHEQARSKLLSLLVSTLSSIKISNRRFIEYRSIENMDELDHALPQGVLRKDIAKILGEPKISDFALDKVARKIRKNEYDSSEEIVSLEALLTKAGVDQIAGEVISGIEALPNQYVVTVPLPPPLNDRIKDSGFEAKAQPVASPQLVVVDSDFQRRYPLREDLEPRSLLGSLMAGDNPPQFKEGTICLQFSTDGYFDVYGTTLAASSASESVRAFFGLGMALGAFVPSYAGVNSAWMTPSQRLVVHKLVGAETFEEDTSVELPREMSDLVGRLQLLVDLENRPLRKALEWGHEQITKVWGRGAGFDQVRRAASWHFDSYTGSNQMLSFLQAMTVIEILVGDQDPEEKGIGLTKLLSNRCAYLLADSRDERERMLKRFAEIYRVRSQIVHVGKSRLTTSEESMLFELRALCRRLLWKEMQSLNN
ncbi:MAG: hypothetical protein EOS63_03590 [Mesorhizobium sp.]|uniref:HEPN domain-containing protein n=1 Tax=Mesorhizobium sp. TaxID=1871066 RepID=UPI000FE983B5|nr:HEPN domain-containing protein [Mesorhizobium sp.]RWE84216.1 MAG: hypothetical protein EOS63_03590 [Mesorhizobium sp.]